MSGPAGAKEQKPMRGDNITLQTKIPTIWHGLPTATEEEQWITLAHAVDVVKKGGLTRLLDRSDQEASEAELSELFLGFVTAVERTEWPTAGQVLAAYWIVTVNQADADRLADRITDRQRAARVGAAARVVFNKTT